MASKTRTILRRKPKGLEGRAGTGQKGEKVHENASSSALRGPPQEASERIRNSDLRLEVIRALGGKCAQCGIEDPRILQIDHIHGGGSRRGLPPYPKILEKIDEAKTLYQVLCANCNFLKRVENKEVRTESIEEYQELGSLEREIQSYEVHVGVPAGLMRDIDHIVTWLGLWASRNELVRQAILRTRDKYIREARRVSEKKEAKSE